jgi:CheY-like chemotaxis protein
MDIVQGGSNEDSDSSSSSERQVYPSLKILIVEDFALTSAILSSALKYCRSAYCFCAESGEEALVIMSEQGPFDLILTDVMMSGMGGIEFIKRVREKEIQCNWEHQTIVAMSADDTKGPESLEAGSSIFIFKYDGTMNKIFEIIDNIIESRKLKR